MYFYEVLRGRPARVLQDDGRRASRKQFPLTGARRRHRWSPASRSLDGDYVALGTADGRVALQQVRFAPKYEDQKLVDLDVEVRDRGVVEIDPAKRPIREVAYEETTGARRWPPWPADDEIAVCRTDDEGGRAAGDPARPRTARGSPRVAPRP